MSKNTQRIQHVAQLSHIPLENEEEAQSLEQAFDETIDVVRNLDELDTSSTEPMHQVGGLENIFRDDVVDTARSFTQKQALANAPRTYKGYVVVEEVLKNKHSHE